jgi:hypothetical protein
MSEDIGSLIKEYHAFYEVSPYYVVRDDRRIQTGFEVDVYGVNTNNTVEAPPPDEYELAYLELQKIAAEVSQRSGGTSCTLDVVPFPSTAIFDVRHQGKVEAMIQIRISHCGDLDQPAGIPEQLALQEIETQLQSRGIARR